MNNIDPCPFCGSSNIGIVSASEPWHDYWYCACADCGCKGPIHFCDRINTDDDESIDAWNRRWGVSND